MDIDWSKAPEGYPVWVESKASTDQSDWHRLESNGYLRDRKGARWEPWQVRDGECVPHYKPEWTGEGLPPVGTVCGFCRFPDTPEAEWSKVRIVAHWSEGLANPVAIFMSTSYAPQADQAVAGCFRAIRTAEQIAAEERGTAIKSMVSIIIDKPELYASAQTAIYYCEALYDANYRKQESK